MAEITVNPSFFEEKHALTEKLLLDLLPQGLSSTLDAAIRYVIEGGGKRLRPLLVFATATLGKDSLLVDRAAVAVEYMHLYSLVHDDLPAMDNDDWRHGQLTCHKVYGEAMAILVGDALQSLAFEVLATPAIDVNKQVKMMAILAKAAGPLGMVGGQALDLDQTTGLLELDCMHEGKTAALIQAAILMGAIAAEVDEISQQKLADFGRNLGLLYQIQDDLLDFEGDQANLGKTPGKDERDKKPTYPRLMGVDYAKKRLDAINGAVTPILVELRADTLRDLLQIILARKF